MIQSYVGLGDWHKNCLFEMHVRVFYKIIVDCNCALWSIQGLVHGPVKQPLVEVQLCRLPRAMQFVFPDNHRHCGLLPALPIRQPGDQIQSQARKQAYFKFQQCPLRHFQIIPLFPPNLQTWHDIVCFPAWGMQSLSPPTKSGVPSLPRTHRLEDHTSASSRRVI